jgi:hypothetical protein
MYNGDEVVEIDSPNDLANFLTSGKGIVSWTFTMSIKSLNAFHPLKYDEISVEQGADDLSMFSSDLDHFLLSPYSGNTPLNYLTHSQINSL